MRTREEKSIWQIQILQLVMNGLLDREQTLGVLAIRGVTKLRRHEELYTCGLCLFREQVLPLESSWDVCEGGDYDVRAGNRVLQGLG